MVVADNMNCKYAGKDERGDDFRYDLSPLQKGYMGGSMQPYSHLVITI